MNWSVFIVVAYLFVAVQQGLAPAMAISTGFGPVIPRFDLVLAATVALFAPMQLTVWIWAALGLAADLLAVYTRTSAGEGLVIVGPNTLGYLVGAYMALQARTMVMRTHPVSLAFVAVVGGAAAGLVSVAFFTLRQWYDPLSGYSASADMATRGMGLLYTAVVAVVLAWAMVRIAPLMGLQTAKPRR